MKTGGERRLPRRGGRPSRLAAGELRERILAVAAELFLARGFGATSIEAVAARAGISKRTFYHRFHDKADLFEAVVRRFIDRWASPAEAVLLEAVELEEALRRLATQILAAALSSEALALHRVVLAEAPRFPALAQVMHEHGAERGIERIAALLEREVRAGRLAPPGGSRFAAEQFLYMVLAAPQRRALGFGRPLAGPDEAEAWARLTVELFLEGCRPRGC